MIDQDLKPARVEAASGPAGLDRDLFARQADLIARHDARVPRYTSYPTAAQFTPEVTPELYAEWLAAIDPRKPVSVYVHVPFCARLCWFCGCNTRVVHGRKPVSDYVDWLRREAAMIEGLLPQGVWANSLHLGGGTPNLLSRDDLNALFGLIRHVFHLAPGAEIAAELDPVSLTQDWVRAAAHHGLSRASLGVQDLSPHVQAAVNRSEDFAVIERSVGWLRAAGVRSVNLDLMYGLPRQTTDDVLSTLDRVLSLRPERIAMFGYAHVPWMKSHQNLIRTEDLPGPVERLEQSQAAEAFLKAQGYVAMGLDHYALPEDSLAQASLAGRLRRNFQGYVPEVSESLIGLGASAISQLAQGYVQNQSAELAWRRQLESGRLPIARGLALSADDRFRGEIIERMMCDFTVDLAAICARHGQPLAALDEDRARLRPLIADGLATAEGTRVSVTDLGRPFVRALCAAFDRHLQPSLARHAQAI